MTCTDLGHSILRLMLSSTTRVGFLFPPSCGRSVSVRDAAGKGKRAPIGNRKTLESTVQSVVKLILILIPNVLTQSAKN